MGGGGQATNGRAGCSQSGQRQLRWQSSRLGDRRSHRRVGSVFPPTGWGCHRPGAKSAALRTVSKELESQTGWWLGITISGRSLIYKATSINRFCDPFPRGDFDPVASFAALPADPLDEPLCRAIAHQHRHLWQGVSTLLAGGHSGAPDAIFTQYQRSNRFPKSFGDPATARPPRNRKAAIGAGGGRQPLHRDLYQSMGNNIYPSREV